MEFLAPADPVFLGIADLLLGVRDAVISLLRVLVRLGVTLLDLWLTLDGFLGLISGVRLVRPDVWGLSLFLWVNLCERSLFRVARRCCLVMPPLGESVEPADDDDGADVFGRCEDEPTEFSLLSILGGLRYDDPDW